MSWTPVDGCFAISVTIWSDTYFRELKEGLIDAYAYN